MAENQPSGKVEFLLPRSRYYGEFTPNSMVFNFRLQEFTNQVGYICSLETEGKISNTEAYRQIKQLVNRLKQNKKDLGNDQSYPGYRGQNNP